MADYYPLISRAVAGLEKNNGENRRALYERARAALIAQLRGVTPALNESDITRERLALEESIRKVEAEVGAPVRRELAPAAVAQIPSDRAPFNRAPAMGRDAGGQIPLERAALGRAGSSRAAPPAGGRARHAAAALCQSAVGAARKLAVRRCPQTVGAGAAAVGAGRSAALRYDVRPAAAAPAAALARG